MARIAQSAPASTTALCALATYQFHRPESVTSPRSEPELHAQPYVTIGLLLLPENVTSKRNNRAQRPPCPRYRGKPYSNPLHRSVKGSALPKYRYPRNITLGPPKGCIRGPAAGEYDGVVGRKRSKLPHTCSQPTADPAAAGSVSRLAACAKADPPIRFMAREQAGRQNRYVRPAWAP